MFWNNVKSELDYLGITQKELADKSGINLGTLKNQICRNVIPNIEDGYRIASALNVSVEYLLTGNNLPGLNDDEMEVMRLYRSLSEADKAMVKMVLSSVSVK